MSAVLSRMRDDAEFECAMRLLRVWNNSAPDAIHDAIGELPEAFLIELANVVWGRITNELEGDCADIGRRLLAHCEASVREAARRETP